MYSRVPLIWHLVGQHIGDSRWYKSGKQQSLVMKCKMHECSYQVTVKSEGSIEAGDKKMWLKKMFCSPRNYKEMKLYEI